MSNSTTEARRHREDKSQTLTAEVRRREGREIKSVPKRPPGSYQGTTFSRAGRVKNIWALAPAVVRNAVRTVRAVLREIFDESAYERFLERSQAARSVDSYREFLLEREEAAVHKPRCC